MSANTPFFQTMGWGWWMGGQDALQAVSWSYQQLTTVHGVNGGLVINHHIIGIVDPQAL